MKVRVGSSIASGANQVIMIYLTDQNKQDITNMASGCNVFCEYPDDLPEKFVEIIKIQMKQLKEECENENI